MLKVVKLCFGKHRHHLVSMWCLFTKHPIADRRELLSRHFEDYVLALFKYMKTSTYFCFDGQFYE
jgi:hypothetical protein